MYLDTIQRDSIIDEDLITGGKKRESKTGSMTLHILQRCTESGELISCGEKQVTRVPSEPGKPQSIKQLALRKRRLSSIRNSGLVSLIKIEFLLTITELVKGEREGKGEIHLVVDIVLIFALH